METTENKESITTINKRALEKINDLITGVTLDERTDKVEQKIKFCSFCNKVYAVDAILDGINAIVYESEGKGSIDSIQILCDLAKQLLPFDELSFLDELILARHYKDSYVKISDLLAP